MTSSAYVASVAPSENWPAPIGGAALSGVIGEFIRIVEPHTEADPAALILQFLTCFGSIIGGSLSTPVESDLHHSNLFVSVVGETSKARKGTSLNNVLAVLRRVDPHWSKARMVSGLSTGEGLIAAVSEHATKETEAVGSTRCEISADRRLLVTETELARTLQALQRRGSTLSSVIRQAWDSSSLQITSRYKPLRVDAAHISIIAHIPREELLKQLTQTESFNGFANRFLWCCARRSRLLPRGGKIDPLALDGVVAHLCAGVIWARALTVLERDDDAMKFWEEVYPRLSEGLPGLLGAVTARAEAQVLRLALVYAVLEQSSSILRRHLEAALEIWRYCEQSARYIFGDSLGDPVADEILEVLRQEPDGLSRTQIRDHFGRHRSQAEIKRALSLLASYRLARMKTVQTGGRPAERWFLGSDDE